MLIIVFFFTFYLSAQMNGAGKVLNVTFGIPNFWGIVIGAAVLVLYTMMGGFLAVVWTDLVQAILMITTLVVLPIVALFEISAQGLSLGDALANAGTVASLTGGKTGWAGAAAIIGGLSWGLGYMGQPHLLTKFMAIRSPQEITMGRHIAFAWAVPAFAGAMLIGLAALALHNGAGFYGDRERVMPALATELFPGWFAGILISGAIAAMMSTADSQLLVISSAVIEDFYRKTLKRELSDRAMVAFSRLITLAVGVAGMVLALTSDKLIFAMVSYAWSGLGSSFGPAILLTLLWKRTTGPAVIAGMLTGALTTVIWSSIPVLDAAVTARLVSFVRALIAVVGFALRSSEIQV
jgi:sodium/proline symporter